MPMPNFFRTVSQWFATPATQAVQPTRPARRAPEGRLATMPSAQTFHAVASHLARLTATDKQLLMLWLYQSNPVTKNLVRKCVDAMIGEGVSVTVPDDAPQAQAFLADYLAFNGLAQRVAQKDMARGYVNTGEICYLTAPHRETLYSVRCSSAMIRQTILDPLNPFEIIGVQLNGGAYEADLIYTRVMDDTRLSQPAKALRASWDAACVARNRPVQWCFYQGHFDHDRVDAAPSGGVAEYQRRGEPLFLTWGDLMNQFMDTLWVYLDRAKSLGLFNFHFQVDTGMQGDFDASIEQVNLWREAIGTPAPNTAIYTDKSVTIQPMSFTPNAGDMQRVNDLMLQMIGLASDTPLYDMGSAQQSPYATANAQGLPQETFWQSIQADIEDAWRDHAWQVLRYGYETGKIPAREWEMLRAASLTITSPELRKKNSDAAAATFLTQVTALEKVLTWGIHDPASVAQAVIQLAQEGLNVTLLPAESANGATAHGTANEPTRNKSA